MKPYIQNLTDLVDAEKVIANHPFVIGEYVRSDVQEWRLAETERLIALRETLGQDSDEERNWIEQEIESVNYALPPRYRVPTVDIRSSK